MSRVSANDRVTLGFIGTGGRGQHLMRVALGNPDVQIAAVCDVMDQRLSQAVQIVGGNAIPYKDFRRLLERKDLDAVFVTTPDHWHCIMTIAACEAGKDVYVEKPLGHNVAEGRAAVNAAKRFNRIVQHGTQQLSGQHYAEARELIRSGAVGKITHVRIVFVKLLRQGKGLVALHHSLASYQTWDEYRHIIGGRWHTQKWMQNGKEQPASTFQHDVQFKVHIVDNKHPVTKGLQDFDIRDETYGNFEVLPKVKPLLTTDEPTSGRVIAWAHTYGKSRVVYIQLGHDHYAYENPHYRRLVLQAIRWVAGR